MLTIWIPTPQEGDLLIKILQELIEKLENRVQRSAGGGAPLVISYQKISLAYANIFTLSLGDVNRLISNLRKVQNIIKQLPMWIIYPTRLTEPDKLYEYPKVVLGVNIFDFKEEIEIIKNLTAALHTTRLNPSTTTAPEARRVLLETLSSSMSCDFVTFDKTWRHRGVLNSESPPSQRRNLYVTAYLSRSRNGYGYHY